MSKALTKGQIQAHSNHQPQRIPIPEWGGDVLMRPLTVRDQEHLDSTTPEELSQRDRALRAVLYSIVDESGKHLFEGGPEDLEWFRDERTKVVTRLLTAFNDQNGSVEEAEEAFEPAPSGSSSTA